MLGKLFDTFVHKYMLNLTLFLPRMEKMIINMINLLKKSYKIEDKVSSHEKKHSMLEGDSITYNRKTIY